MLACQSTKVIGLNQSLVLVSYSYLKEQKRYKDEKEKMVRQEKGDEFDIGDTLKIHSMLDLC